MYRVNFKDMLSSMQDKSHCRSSQTQCSLRVWEYLIRNILLNKYPDILKTFFCKKIAILCKLSKKENIVFDFNKYKYKYKYKLFYSQETSIEAWEN